MRLIFETTCGEKTCAESPGVFCQFCGTKRLGTKPWCIWYNVELFEENGWLQRCSQCVNDARRSCRWVDDKDGNWETGCNQVHVFIEGDPIENKHDYCPYCGRKIVVPELVPESEG
jgi:hypothetical protein